MLGAQALRTKQKVDQKEKEKRHKERQRNLELQRERIQRAANEDAQVAMYEYVAAAAAEAAATASTSGYNDDHLNESSNENKISLTKSAELAQRFHQLAIGSNPGYMSNREGRNSTNGVNRKIHQRYSLHQNLMPISAREFVSFDHHNMPKRSPSSDCGKMMKMDAGLACNGRSSRSGSYNQPNNGNRLLRWLGIGSSNSSALATSSSVIESKKRNNTDGANCEKRRMSTY